MKKKLFVGFATGLFLGSIVSSSGAAIVTYTDQTLWEAAVGTTTLYDFESAAIGSFTYMDFGDFDATLTDPYPGIDPSITNYEGSNVLQLQVWDNESNLDFEMDTGILALGFDWWNTDTTYDNIEFIIDGTNYVFGPSLSNGFFGITSDVAFTSFSLSDSYGDGGALDKGYIDNLQYSASAPVPEPATMFLFGTGLAGLVGSRIRKKKR